MSLDISPMVPAGRQLIQSYGDGQFTISDIVYTGPVIVLPEETRSWSPADPSNFTTDDFNPVLALEEPVDIFLLGCGQTGQFIHPSLRDALRESGITIEAMDTGAACRTFNVLLSEDRRVAAALLPVE